MRILTSYSLAVMTLSDRIIEVRAAESDGDPLADIKNLRRVAAVVFEGQVAH